MVDVAAGVFVPPHRRNLGMVFQSYAIWPHMTVMENVAYALEGRGIGKAERQQARDGGARNRAARASRRPAGAAALGRPAAARRDRARPGRAGRRCCCSTSRCRNLDARLRIEMRNELRRIQKQIGLTSIYVTHDQAEALAISDWIVVMKDGRIVERGRPLDIYRYPRHVFTAQFLGTTNLIAGTVEERRRGHWPCRGRRPRSAASSASIRAARSRAGAKVRVSIRPEDLSPSTRRTARMRRRSTRFDGRLTFAVFAGAAVEAEVRCGETSLQCLLNREADLTPGRAITLRAQRGCLPGAAGARSE